MFSIAVAGAVFVLAWNFRRFYQNSFLTFIGAAYLACSFIDLLHALAYKGMGILQGYDADLPTQLWIAARYLQSISLLAAPLFLKRRVHMAWLLAGFSAVTAPLLLSIFVWDIFPVCFVEGVGLSPFKITSEYVINLMLAGAIALLLRSRHAIDRRVLRWMVLSIAFTMLSELAFTFYVDVYGLSNLIGHFGKIIAYYLVYKAVIETEAGAIYANMTQLRETESALRARERILTGINRIFQEALTCPTEEALGAVCLAVAEQVTGSRFGFIGKHNEQTGMVDDIAISDPGWAACQITTQAGHGKKLPVGFPVRGLYGRVLREGKSFHTNAPANHPDSAGTPAGHPPLEAFLAAPLIDDRQPFGLVALGNRPGGYGEAELEALDALAPAIAQVLLNKRAESALRESEKRFRAVVESNMIGVFFTDLDTGAVTGANDEFLRIIGRSRAELEHGDLNWRAITPPDALAHEDRERFTAPSGQHLAPYEKEYLRPDGSRVPVIVGGSFLDDDHNAVVAYVLDNTERKRMTEELAQANAALLAYAERLKNSNRELEQFAFVASHDLQEPLRKIKMFGGRLEQQLARHPAVADAEQAADDMRRMQNAVERMQAMIDGLLELSRVNTRSGAFAPTLLTPVVEEVVADLEARVQASGGQVAVEELFTAEVDEQQIRRLFQNLIGNALKFHKPGVAPIIEISAALTRAATSAGDESTLWITVKDNGIGFDQKDAQRIFQPFQRLHGRSEYEGYGLGLSICQKIVERHSGRIEVRSQPGVGSEFCIILPVRQPGN
jgi:PAS domain S-box-containing protein